MSNADKSPFSQARRTVAESYKKKGLPGPIAQVAAFAKLGWELGPNANKKLTAVPTNAANVPFSAEKAAEQREAEKAAKLSRDIENAKAKLPTFKDDEEIPSRANRLAGTRDSLYVTRTHILGQSRHEAVAEKPSDEIESFQQKLLGFQDQTVERRPSPSFRKLRDSVSFSPSRNPAVTDSAPGQSGDAHGDGDSDRD